MSHDIDRGFVVFGLQHGRRKLYAIGIQYAVSNLFNENGNNKTFFKLLPPMNEAMLKNHLGLVAEDYFVGNLEFGSRSDANMYKRVTQRIREVFDRRDRFTLDISDVKDLSDLDRRLLDAIRTREVRGRIREETTMQPHFENGVRDFIDDMKRRGLNTVAEFFDHWVKDSESRQTEPCYIDGVLYFDELMEKGERLGEWLDACKAERRRFWNEDKKAASSFYGADPQVSFLRQVFDLGEQKTPGIGRSLEETMELLRAHNRLTRQQIDDEMYLIIRDAYVVAGDEAFENPRYAAPIESYLTQALSNSVRQRNGYPYNSGFELHFDENGAQGSTYVGRVMVSHFPRSDALADMLKRIIVNGIDAAGGDPRKRDILINLIDLNRRAIREGMSADEYESHRLAIVRGQPHSEVKAVPTLDVEQLDEALELEKDENAHRIEV